MKNPAVLVLPLAVLALVGLLAGSVSPTPGRVHRLESRPAKVLPVSRSLVEAVPLAELAGMESRRPAVRELLLLSQLERAETGAGRRVALGALLKLDQQRPLCRAAMHRLARETLHSADEKQRAVAVLILNRRRETALRDSALLSTLWRDSSALVRRTAAWGVGHLGGPSLTLKQQRAVMDRLLREPDQKVSWALIDSLLQRGVAQPDRASRDLLKLALSIQPGELRQKLLSALGQLTN